MSPPPPAGSIDAAALGSASPDVLDALVASVADAIYVVDHEGMVRFANPAALTILGFDEEQLLGRPSHATIHYRRPDGQPCPESRCPLLRPRVTGETVRVEDDWFVRRDGTMVPVAYSSAPIWTTAGRGAVVVFRDTSERRRAEQADRREAAERARAEELAASRARIVEAADAERRRLGRDLHDGAQQRLMNVAMAINQGLGRLDDDPAAARALLVSALEETRATLADLRELASGIHPAILTNRGLAAAVESLTARTPIPVRLEIADERHPPAIEACAYFVIAEALANVAKHAGATRARVTVVREGEQLLVTVADDGRGGADLSVGRGLQGLRDRVATVGGTLRVEDVADGGTRVVAALPRG